MSAGPPIGRVYRMVWWFRLFAVAFLAIGGLVAFEVNRGATGDPDSLRRVTALGTISLSVAGLFLMARAFTTNLEFSSDSITLRWVLHTRRLEYSRIRGRREFVVTGEEASTRYLRLEATDGSKPFDIGKNMYGFDDVFWDWYYSLVDLDAGDKDQR